MSTKLLVHHISSSYHSPRGATPALSDVSFSVETGEFFAIVGPSGCGKSTLLSLIAGLMQPEEGSILLDGLPVSEAKSHVGYMLQRDHLFEWRTIYGNVSLGPEIRARKEHPFAALSFPHPRRRNLPPAAATIYSGQSEHPSQDRLLRMMQEYGLSGFEQARPSALSGGMRQRAALIRTLALAPELLLLDEPFSALDYQTRLSVCDDINGIIRSNGNTAILVTHDLSEAISTADRILVLSARPGRVKAILPVSFDPQYDSPLKRRNAPEFSRYFNRLWVLLRTDDTRRQDPPQASPSVCQENEEE